jgi:hypothetical protein
MTTWPIPRHWRSYDNDPLPTGKEVLDEPFRAFPLRFQAKDTTRATTAMASAVQCPGFLATCMVPMLFEPHTLVKVLLETVGITAADVNETMLEQARSRPTNETCAMASGGRPSFLTSRPGFVRHYGCSGPVTGTCSTCGIVSARER